MGFLGTAIALGLYKRLRAKEEVSTVPFLLNPKKTVQDIRLIYYVSIVSAVCWSIYLFGCLVYFDVIYFPITKSIFVEILFFDPYYYSSAVFGMSCLFVFEGWRRGIEKYA